MAISIISEQLSEEQVDDEVVWPESETDIQFDDGLFTTNGRLN